MLFIILFIFFSYSCGLVLKMLIFYIQYWSINNVCMYIYLSSDALLSFSCRYTCQIMQMKIKSSERRFVSLPWIFLYFLDQNMTILRLILGDLFESSITKNHWSSKIIQGKMEMKLINSWWVTELTLKDHYVVNKWQNFFTSVVLLIFSYSTVRWKFRCLWLRT